MNFRKVAALNEERIQACPNINRNKWGRAYDDINDNVHLIGRDRDEVSILRFWFGRLFSPHYGYLPSLHETAEATKIPYSTVKLKVSNMAADQEGRGPLLLRTPERGQKTGIDLAPALAAIDETLAQQEKQQKRSHHAQRPAQAAQAAARPRSASAHQAPRPAAPARIEASAADANWWAEHAAILSDAEQEQEEAAPVRSAAPSMEQADQAGPIEASAPRSIEAPAAQEQPAAPALPAECSAVLVAFLAPLHREKELPALVAFVQQQRGPLNDTGLLVALERAREAATRDIEADQRGPHRIRTSFGLFKHKISEAIAQGLQQRETAARRAAEQEQEEARLLAGLNEDGQRFYAYGKGLDWPIFRYGRIWGGADDWLHFAVANQEDKGALYAALASIKEADQGEQAGPIEAPAAPVRPAAPARIEAPATPSREQPGQGARIIPLRRRTGPRYELESLAARKGYPNIIIPGAGRIEGERWQRFIWDTRLENVEKALGLLKARPDVIEADTAPAQELRSAAPGLIGQADQPAKIEAPAAPAQEADRPARKKRRIIDKLTKFASDSAAGLL